MVDLTVMRTFIHSRLKIEDPFHFIFYIINMFIYIYMCKENFYIHTFGLNCFIFFPLRNSIYIIILKIEFVIFGKMFMNINFRVNCLEYLSF